MIANPDNQQFIEAVKKLKKGETLKLEDGVLELEYDLADTEKNLEAKMNFPFHQRIFPIGIILHKLDTEVRIFIPAEQLA